MSDIAKHLNQFEMFNGIANNDLEPIDSRGLAHDHLKIGQSGWILRVPRGNQLDMNDKDYLELQKSIYSEMAASGAAPKIHAVINPNHDLPHGALIIEYIKGRPVQTQNNLQAIAKCLAKIHSLPVPQGTNLIQRASSPLQSQLFLINEFLSDVFNNAALSTQTAQLLDNERKEVISEIQALKPREDLPYSIIGGDSHLGNYLIDKNGDAFLVDLEFASYDLALIDLADASLEITSRLDPNNDVRPDEHMKSEFYKTWSNALSAPLSDKLSNLIPLTERTVQLRTLAWLVYWVSEGRAKEINKTPKKSVRNWDELTSTYLNPVKLASMLNKPVSSVNTPAWNL